MPCDSGKDSRLSRSRAAQRILGQSMPARKLRNSTWRGEEKKYRVVPEMSGPENGTNIYV